MSHHYIKYTGVSYSYPDGHKAVNNVSFHITHGERVALLGPNGAGKSTLLLMGNGLLMPSEGEVNIGGVPMCKKTLRLIRQSVGMVFQNPDDQLFMPTVAEDVAFGPLNMGLPANEVERRVNWALQQVGAQELYSKSPMQLSGGQKRKVAVATVMSMCPSVLIMDEPTSNLDFKGRRDLIDLLKKFEHTQVIATHDLAMVGELCTRVIVIDHGKLIADGATAEVLSNPNVCQALSIMPHEIAKVLNPQPHLAVQYTGKTLN